MIPGEYFIEPGEIEINKGRKTGTPKKEESSGGWFDWF